MKNVAVIGLGYVGLPLAMLCAIKGHQTVGLEANEDIVKKLSGGQSHIKDNYVERLLEKVGATGRFRASARLEDLAACSLYLICVPTPVDENLDPDLGPVLGALESIAPFIAKGDLVVVESTVFPGTCEAVVIPKLEQLTKMEVGVDFHLAHCPERVNPGDSFWTVENIPRVVGSTSGEGVAAAAEFYAGLLGGEVFDVSAVRSRLRPKYVENSNGPHANDFPVGSVVMMHSIRDAEAVKAMENTVRDVNIAFVNELAKVSDVLDLNVIEIIDGMATKPFGKGPFYPGVGVGGHCIAVDPEWLKSASIKAGYFPEIIQLARSTNNSMPQYAVALMQDALNECACPVKGTKIAVLGVAYKKNVDDLRESPFYEVRALLKGKGAVLSVFDSWITKENTTSSVHEALKGATAVMIVTDHDDLVTALKKADLKAMGIKVIIDGRNCIDRVHVEAQGVVYNGIGR